MRQPSIKAFGQVQKHSSSLHTARSFDSKVSTTKEKVCYNEPSLASIQTRKRSRAEDPDEENGRDCGDTRIKNPNNSDGSRQDTTPVRKSISTPRKKRQRLQSLPTPESTPSKCASRHTSLEPQLSPLSAPDFSHKEITPPATPKHHESLSDFSQIVSRLPSALEDMLKLQSSFLSALALHLAHGGIATPVDTRVLCHSVSKVWGRRKVILDDLKRCLGVLHAQNTIAAIKPVPFYCGLQLSDYGNGKICIERLEVALSGTANIRTLPEDALNIRFESNLRELWTHWSLDNILSSSAEDAPSLFIEQLPMAEITPCPALRKAKPLVSEGQRRLTDLMSVAKATHDMQRSEPVRDQIKSETSIKSRSTSLIARLQEKAARAAALPAAPSKSELERTAALQKIPEIVDILSTSRKSSTNGLRSSHGMNGLVQSIRNSSRSAISREEVERCLSLLAEEIAPSFVTIIKRGALSGVVLDWAARPHDLDERLRVAA